MRKKNCDVSASLSPVMGGSSQRSRTKKKSHLAAALHSDLWSGQRDVSAFEVRTRTGFGRLWRPRPLAKNAPRFLDARALAGSNPAARQHRLPKEPPQRTALRSINGAGNGTRTRECQLGKLMPYHLAMPAWRPIVAQERRRHRASSSISMWLWALTRADGTIAQY